MEERFIRVDLRLLAVGVTLLAVGLLVALVANTDSTDVALAQTALVLAVIAFIADLAIALTSYMASAQSEARMRQTNTEMQTALVKVDERTEEVRNLVRLQGERLLDMIGRRVMASAPPPQRDVYQKVLSDMAEELRTEPLVPPGGGKEGRQKILNKALEDWVEKSGWTRLGPQGRSHQVFETKTDGPIHVVLAMAGDFRSNLSGARPHLYAAKWIKDDWPGREVRTAVLVENSDGVPWWDGSKPDRYGTLLVTVDNLDSALSGPIADTTGIL